MAQAGVPEGPSEAELEQFLRQMREAPAEQVVVEVVNVLLQAAQVKLGRPDARLLIDAVAAVAETAQGRADATLLNQISQAVSQLRLAQVEAESGASDPRASADDQVSSGATARTEPRPDDSTAVPPPAASSPQRSRLWTPGG